MSYVITYKQSDGSTYVCDRDGWEEEGTCWLGSLDYATVYDSLEQAEIKWGEFKDDSLHIVDYEVAVMCEIMDERY